MERLRLRLSTQLMVYRGMGGWRHAQGHAIQIKDPPVSRPRRSVTKRTCREQADYALGSVKGKCTRGDGDCPGRTDKQIIVLRPAIHG